MEPWNVKGSRTAQDFVRAAIELCADCDTCRDLIEQECRCFPELYRLYDGQVESGAPIPDAKLRSLAEACTYCGLCPCPEIPAWLTEAKAQYAEREGLPRGVRLMVDVPRLARACGTFPRVAEAMQRSSLLAPVIRSVGRIHRERTLPGFARESFFQWAARNGLTERKEGEHHATYFAGCTAGYLFPEVGRAVVAVLQRNGLTVHVPSQQCCGMPFLVEGDRASAVRKVRANVELLLRSVRVGDDVLTSCPTCGFMMKVLLKEKAYYSEEYQRSVGSADDELRVPDPASGTLNVVKRSQYRGILKDDGFFASVPALERIGVADHVRDAGEYLTRLRAEGRLDTGFAPITSRVAYFAPCHQRQQRMGRPYLELLRLVPGLTVEQVGETECCGMGGNFGFKASHHEASLAVGRPVFERIERLAPDAVVTDCLSCRLQFRHALRYPVFHPMELLSRAYRSTSGPAD